MPARIDSGARTFDDGEASFPGPPGRPESTSWQTRRGRGLRPRTRSCPAETPTLASLMTLARRRGGGRGALFRARRVPADRARGAARLRARAVRRSPAPAAARARAGGDRRGARRARRHRHARHGHRAAGRASSRATCRATSRRSGTRSRAEGRRPRPPVRAGCGTSDARSSEATKDDQAAGPDAGAGAGRARAAEAAAGRGPPARPHAARARAALRRADPAPAGDGRHHLRGADLHPAPARGSARPHDPAVRVERSPPHHRRDGRRGAAALAGTSSSSSRSTPPSGSGSSRSGCG